MSYTPANKKANKNWRKNNEEKWNSYFTPYFKKWLEDDANWLSHSARTIINSRLRRDEEHKRKIAIGLSIDHIIPLAFFCDYFKKFIDRKNKKTKKELIAILNNPLNIRYIPRSKNHKATIAPLNLLLDIAVKMAMIYPTYCGDLPTHIIRVYMIGEEI